MDLDTLKWANLARSHKSPEVRAKLQWPGVLCAPYQRSMKGLHQWKQMDLIGRWPHTFGPFGFIFRVTMLLCQWPSNGCRDLHIAKLTNNVFIPSSQDLIILVRYMSVMFCCFLWFCTIHSKSHLSWTWFSFESHLYPLTSVMPFSIQHRIKMKQSWLNVDIVVSGVLL